MMIGPAGDGSVRQRSFVRLTKISHKPFKANLKPQYTEEIHFHEKSEKFVTNSKTSRGPLLGLLIDINKTTKKGKKGQTIPRDYPLN
jgi:hypothetical protein